MTSRHPPAASPGCTRLGPHDWHRLCQEVVHFRARRAARQVSVLERERVLGVGYDRNNVLARDSEKARGVGRVQGCDPRIPCRWLATGKGASLDTRPDLVCLETIHRLLILFIEVRRTETLVEGREFWAVGQSQGPERAVTPPGMPSLHLEAPEGGSHVLASLLGLGKKL